MYTDIFMAAQYIYCAAPYSFHLTIYLRDFSISVHKEYTAYFEASQKDL